MRVTLVNHPGLKKTTGLQLQSPSPPIGLAYLGAYLRRHGYDYVAVDGCGEALDRVRPHESQPDTLVQGLTPEEVAARVPADSDVVGFTSLFSHCWPLVQETVEAIRARVPNALFVAGGEHPSALAENVLNSAPIDVVVLGEGEETFLAIVRCVEAGESWRELDGTAHLSATGDLVRNRARKRSEEVDEFPYPDWDSWCIESYIAEQQVTGVHLGRTIPILGSRGCPYACTFCSSEQMWTRRYIMRDAVGLVDEMEFMKRKYGVTGFSFMDSTFVVSRRRTLAFCQELIRRDLDVNYQLPAGTRCEAFNDELAAALEASGLRNFAFAPESGDELIIKAIKKQIDLDRFIEAVRTVLRTNMTVGCFFVVGFPEDTPHSLRKSLKLIRRLALMGVHDVTVSKFTPYPGSEYFDQLVREKKLSADFRELRYVIDFFSDEGRSYTDALTHNQLHRWMLWAFVNFYVISFAMRPWRLIRNLWAYLRQGVERARYVRFFAELVFRRRRWRNRTEA